MNTNLVMPSERHWPLDHSGGGQVSPGVRNYSAANILDFVSLVRIIQHWRWLVFAAISLGLVGAILASMLTRPVYRAWVTLEANPPGFAVTDEQSIERQQVGGTDTYQFVATQVGLVQSRSVAERAAQDLNLANNPDVVAQTLEPSKRLRAAVSVIQGNLRVVGPDQGELIKFSFDFDLAATGGNGRECDCWKLYR